MRYKVKSQENGGASPPRKKMKTVCYRYDLNNHSFVRLLRLALSRTLKIAILLGVDYNHTLLEKIRFI